jgi:hypothetical protein
MEIVVAFHVNQLRPLLVHPLERIDDWHVGVDHSRFSDPELEDVAKQNHHFRFSTQFFKEGQHGLIVRIGRLAKVRVC